MGTADMHKHTEEELREGIAKADSNEQRLEAEGKHDAEQALQEQREAMADELERRDA